MAPSQYQPQTAKHRVKSGYPAKVVVCTDQWCIINIITVAIDIAFDVRLFSFILFMKQTWYALSVLITAIMCLVASELKAELRRSPTQDPSPNGNTRVSTLASTRASYVRVS